MNVGDRLGKYRLTRRAGGGAMGVVWAAVNEDTHKEVALKLLPVSDAELRRRLLREAKACGRLDHRNIVTIYDVGTTPGGDPFLVMQLLSGETLARRLERERRLPPAVAAGIGAAIAAGLGAAHAAGIVHRDLKPENIFLHREPGSPGEVVKLLDFGVSRLELSGDAINTATGVLVGSPVYMSPEQARTSKEVGPRSLGAVLFEMLAGQRPFQGRTVADALALDERRGEAGGLRGARELCAAGPPLRPRDGRRRRALGQRDGAGDHPGGCVGARPPRRSERRRHPARAHLGPPGAAQAHVHFAKPSGSASVRSEPKHGGVEGAGF
jgi:serine/threonine protein kinase